MNDAEAFSKLAKANQELGWSVWVESMRGPNRSDSVRFLNVSVESIEKARNLLNTILVTVK